ncbi:hypothetical protein [Alkalicoccus daliensis]|uniref:Uncharacterized protein n=1 Tax=Alkalicoccus daliensis TaxID=745820 RepID=A0A1G9ZJ02_9BACI|nr:hypothetical protein [Alkalicoccus daliensis]SDN21298.1 hypothetical protein SAMN04488053_101126 [Alkalicoccus daliensis]
MKLSLHDLPVSEQAVYTALKELPLEEKKTLWRLLQYTNKDHICLIPFPTANVAALNAKNIIVENPNYRGSGKSYYVLRNAPHLMKKLQAFAGRPNPLS